MFLQNCLVISQAANILGFILFKKHLKEELTTTSLHITAFKVGQSKEDYVVTVGKSLCFQLMSVFSLPQVEGEIVGK